MLPQLLPWFWAGYIFGFLSTLLICEWWKVTPHLPSTNRLPAEGSSTPRTQQSSAPAHKKVPLATLAHFQCSDGKGRDRGFPNLLIYIEANKEESHHLLHGWWDCHREQSRADWKVKWVDSSSNTTKSTSKCLSTHLAANTIWIELGSLGHADKSRGLQPFCWVSPHYWIPMYFILGTKFTTQKTKKTRAGIYLFWAQHTDREMSQAFLITQITPSSHKLDWMLHEVPYHWLWVHV